MAGMVDGTWAVHVKTQLHSPCHDYMVGQTLLATLRPSSDVTTLDWFPTMAWTWPIPMTADDTVASESAGNQLRCTHDGGRFFIFRIGSTGLININVEVNFEAENS